MSYEQDISENFNIITNYKKRIKSLDSNNKEQPRSYQFALLLNNLYGIDSSIIEKYIEGIEKTVRTQREGQIIWGEIDNLFGNLIIEFESKLPKKIKEAEEQLCKYTSIIWNGEKQKNLSLTPFVCVATDGTIFNTYTPVISDVIDEIKTSNIILEKIEEVNWDHLSLEDILNWLDYYLARNTYMPATSENIVKDFGNDSHTFNTINSLLYREWIKSKHRPAFSVIFDNWMAYLRVIYGNQIGNDQLFIKHTYLCTLSKVIAWMKFSSNNTKTSMEESLIVKILDGRYFVEQGISNYVDEDFFSWILRDEKSQYAKKIVRNIHSLLKNYDLCNLNEDILKSLYQELIEPKTRHYLGEFYTPDWLAHKMVNKLLDEKNRGSIIDPSCGSGTFLYIAIREKIKRHGKSLDTLRHILENVVGADIHPLAVMISKTNYLLALDDLIHFIKKNGAVNIPVYLSDTISIPKETKLDGVSNLKAHLLKLENEIVQIPKSLFENFTEYDKTIDIAKESALRWKNSNDDISLTTFRKVITSRGFSYSENEDVINNIYQLTKTLKGFLDKDRDSIWAFILKNMYRPLFWNRKFDFILGNPPWITYKDLETSYQKFVLEQVVEKYKLLDRRPELISNIELATLFFIIAADLYLKERGVIAFVLPRTVFNGEQNDLFRKNSYTMLEKKEFSLAFDEVWDCENIKPLFSIPACIVVAKKVPMKEECYPIKGKILKGTLIRKNASLAESDISVEETNTKYYLTEFGKYRSAWTEYSCEKIINSSYYKSKFERGAELTPRSFWFVKLDSVLTYDPNFPPVISGPTSKSGPNKSYRDISIKGKIEKKFIFCTILGDDLIPFGIRSTKLVVLPIREANNVSTYNIINVEQANQLGYWCLADWLKKAERLWQHSRNTSSKKTTGLYDYLNMRNKLTTQNSSAKYYVIYPNFQRNSIATVVNISKTIKESTKTHGVSPQDIIIDTAFYYLETGNIHEAYYLCAILNSDVIDKLLEPLRRSNQKNHPNVHKKVFDVASIPKYDKFNETHRRLSALGYHCSKMVKHWITTIDSKSFNDIGKIRGMARLNIKNELLVINNLVKDALDNICDKNPLRKIK